METVVEAGPAEVYDRAFVPALFAQWGPVVAAAAGVAAGRPRARRRLRHRCGDRGRRRAGGSGWPGRRA